MVTIKGTTCMVRVGGGYERLEDYIESHQDQEIDRIRRLIEDTGKSYDQVVIDLLKKYGAEDDVIKKVKAQLKLQFMNYMKKMQQELDIQIY